MTLRVTSFKTSNGSDLHVLLIAADDAQDDHNFLENNVERIELGKLKGNKGDQNYDIPTGTHLTKFHTSSDLLRALQCKFRHGSGRRVL